MIEGRLNDPTRETKRERERETGRCICALCSCKCQGENYCLKRLLKLTP